MKHKKQEEGQETEITKEEVEEKVIILNELPTVQTRKVTDNEGNEYNVLTRDEALTEILESVREMKKVVG